MGKSIIQTTIKSVLQNNAGSISLSKIGEGLVAGGFLLNDYSSRRDEGSSALGAAFGAVAEQGLAMATGFSGYMAFELARNSGVIVDAVEKLAAQRRAWYANEQYQAPFRTNTFVDNEQLYTMRQAGMELAKQAKYKQVAALMGNEARYMHR